MPESPITTHVLDIAKGKPAQGVTVMLERYDGKNWEKIAEGKTNIDGRITDLVRDPSRWSSGRYRLEFDTRSYFSKTKTETFFPYVHIVFEISDPKQHTHVPLLLSPFGYSTYRGS